MLLMACGSTKGERWLGPLLHREGKLPHGAVISRRARKAVRGLLAGEPAGTVSASEAYHAMDGTFEGCHQRVGKVSSAPSQSRPNTVGDIGAAGYRRGKCKSRTLHHFP
jgi:hypothetical protein